MERRQLGLGGPELTGVGLGTWARGGPWQFGWGALDDDDSVAAIRHAVGSGVNWIDTAAVYGLGHSEEVVGRALAGFDAGREVLVATKCGRNWYDSGGEEVVYDLRPASIRNECEQSLRRLGVERIDLYQIHWPDLATGTAVEESWGTMAELVDEGKARWIGVSNFDVELLERCRAVRHVDSARNAVLPWCVANGTGAVVHSPMAAGLLTGTFDRGRLAGLPEDDWRRRAPAFQEPQLSANLALVERLRPLLAQRHGTTLSALAVAWTLAQGGVTSAIVGARRPGQVDGWLPAPELALGRDDLEEIERAIEETGAGTDETPSPPPLVRVR